MTVEQFDAFVAGPRMCHFAVAQADEGPRVRPMWFLWKDGAIVGTTRSSVRVIGRAITDGARVGFSIASDDEPYRAVVGWGHAQELAPDRELLTELVERYYGRAGALEWVEQVLAEEPDLTAFRVVPQTLTSWQYDE